ncbi:hypothetical protein P7C70_g7409, partial [Phenoliferia sp. Uapishka_3]
MLPVELPGLPPLNESLGTHLLTMHDQMAMRSSVGADLVAFEQHFPPSSSSTTTFEVSFSPTLSPVPDLDRSLPLAPPVDSDSKQSTPTQIYFSQLARPDSQPRFSDQKVTILRRRRSTSLITLETQFRTRYQLLEKETSRDDHEGFVKLLLTLALAAKAFRCRSKENKEWWKTRALVGVSVARRTWDDREWVRKAGRDMAWLVLSESSRAAPVVIPRESLIVLFPPSNIPLPPISPLLIGQILSRLSLQPLQPQFDHLLLTSFDSLSAFSHSPPLADLTPNITFVVDYQSRLVDALFGNSDLRMGSAHAGVWRKLLESQLKIMRLLLLLGDSGKEERVGEIATRMGTLREESFATLRKVLKAVVVRKISNPSIELLESLTGFGFVMSRFWSEGDFGRLLENFQELETFQKVLAFVAFADSDACRLQKLMADEYPHPLFAREPEASRSNTPAESRAARLVAEAVDALMRE